MDHAFIFYFDKKPFFDKTNFDLKKTPLLNCMTTTSHLSWSSLICFPKNVEFDAFWSDKKFVILRTSNSTRLNPIRVHALFRCPTYSYTIVLTFFMLKIYLNLFTENISIYQQKKFVMSFLTKRINETMTVLKLNLDLDHCHRQIERAGKGKTGHLGRIKNQKVLWYTFHKPDRTPIKRV